MTYNYSCQECLHKTWTLPQMDFPISLVLFAVDLSGGGVGGISAIKPFGCNNMSSHGDLVLCINGRILNVLDYNVTKRGLSLLLADLPAGMPPRRRRISKRAATDGVSCFWLWRGNFLSLYLAHSPALSLSLSPTPSLWTIFWQDSLPPSQFTRYCSARCQKNQIDHAAVEVLHCGSGDSQMAENNRTLTTGLTDNFEGITQ